MFLIDWITSPLTPTWGHQPPITSKELASAISGVSSSLWAADSSLKTSRREGLVPRVAPYSYPHHTQAIDDQWRVCVSLAGPRVLRRKVFSRTSFLTEAPARHLVLISLQVCNQFDLFIVNGTYNDKLYLSQGAFWTWKGALVTKVKTLKMWNCFKGG